VGASERGGGAGRLVRATGRLVRTVLPPERRTRTSAASLRRRRMPAGRSGPRPPSRRRTASSTKIRTGARTCSAPGSHWPSSGSCSSGSSSTDSSADGQRLPCARCSRSRPRSVQDHERVRRRRPTGCGGYSECGSVPERSVAPSAVRAASRCLAGTARGSTVLGEVVTQAATEWVGVRRRVTEPKGHVRPVEGHGLDRLDDQVPLRQGVVPDVGGVARSHLHPDGRARGGDLVGGRREPHADERHHGHTSSGKPGPTRHPPARRLDIDRLHAAPTSPLARHTAGISSGKTAGKWEACHTDPVEDRRPTSPSSATPAR
jgi:hypothetical protein